LEKLPASMTSMNACNTSLTINILLFASTPG
jgi:hypothetical protein